MQRFQQIDYILPAHWAPIICNSDFTGITDEEEEQYHAFIDGEFGDSLFSTATLASPVDDAEFVIYHDARPYGVLACDCLHYSFFR